MEVAGVALAILPLLISAAEHYEDVFRPFKRYHKFAPELEQYQQKLRTQKTIFRNECQLLLVILTGGKQTAKDMLKEKQHPLWEDPELNEKFNRQLGDSALACKTTVELIQVKLKSIEEESESFGLVIQQSVPHNSIGDKAWRARVGKKLKFSISESRLDTTLKEMRKLNQDFCTLAEQTRRFEDEHRKLEPQFSSSPRSEHKAGEYQMIQKASTQLYTSLERACQLHDEHLAHFRLESQRVTIEDQGTPLVRFHITFAHQEVRPQRTLEPVWIAIHSTVEEPTHEDLEDEKVQKSLVSLTNTLKREGAPACLSSKKRIKGKSVRFVTTSCVGPSTTGMLLASFLEDPTLPDFCVQHDFCRTLQTCGPKSPAKKNLGYFQKFGPFKHLVYLAPQISCSGSHSTSLATIISSMSKRSRADQCPQYERLRLARQLAAAVLQFHATPILNSNWRSEDVVFYGANSSSSVLTIPHLNVRFGKVCTTSNSLPAAASSTVAHNELPSFIRNPFLFRLAIILIELAYQAPLHQIEDSIDLQDLSARDSDFFVANRLSKSIGMTMGSTYGKVVRKCLGCDFGEGTTDLADPGLQRVFYRDVVCELERLETKFAKLQLGF